VNENHYISVEDSYDYSIAVGRDGKYSVIARHVDPYRVHDIVKALNDNKPEEKAF
jgi:hypothetical protein